MINENNNTVLEHTALDVALKEVVSRGENDLAEEIKRVMEQNQIPTPTADGNHGVSSIRYYKVDMSTDDVERVVEILYDLEVEYAQGDNIATANFYAHVADKWASLL